MIKAKDYMPENPEDLIARCTCRECGEEFTKIRHDWRYRQEPWAWRGYGRGYGRTYDDIDLCPDCYNEEGKREAYEALETLGVPQLKGSEKQIAWAKRLRVSRIFNMLEYYIDRHTDWDTTITDWDTPIVNPSKMCMAERVEFFLSHKDDEIEADLVQAICYCINQSESRFWIEVDIAPQNLVDLYRYYGGRLWRK